MKKWIRGINIKKIVGIFLVVIIMVCSIELVFTGETEGIVIEAAKRTIKADSSLLVDTIHYTAFGDSIATGYGLENYQEDILHSAKDAYREQVAEELTIQYPNTEIFTDSFAINGLNSTQLRTYLTDPENEQYEIFRKAAAESDIITLSIGSNDILGPFMEAGAQELGCSIEELYNTLNERLTSNSFIELISLLDSAERMNKILAGLPEDTNAETAERAILEHTIEGNEEFNQACIRFAENLQVILETIHTLSPEAEIFVTNIYNPYKGVAIINPLTSICVFDIGNLAEFYIQKLNQAFTIESEWYHLIDVKTAFDSVETMPVNVDISGAFHIDFTLEQYSLDPHPSAKGHAIIASLIKEKMIEAPILTRKFLPKEGTRFGAGNFQCKIEVSNEENREVIITGIKKKIKKVIIPDMILIDEYPFKVTSIGRKAWKGDKKITSLIIGKNIKKIQKKAFYQCGNLEKIKVESKEIIKIGAKAFKKLSKNVSFQFPKQWERKYKKLFER